MAYDKTLGYDPDKDYAAEINQLQLQKQQTVGGMASTQGGMTVDQINTLINQNLAERDKKLASLNSQGVNTSQYPSNSTVSTWDGGSNNPGQWVSGGAYDGITDPGHYNPYNTAYSNVPAGLGDSAGFTEPTGSGAAYSALPNAYIGSGSGVPGGNSTDFMSMYNAYNQNVANSLNDNAAWLASQQGNYNDMFNAYSQQLSNMRDSSMQAYRDAILASVEQGRQQYQAQENTVNQNQDALARQAYIRMMQNQRDIPQQLAGMGLTGGMTESANVANRANYGNQQNDINMQRNQQLADIQNAIISLVNNGQISIAEAQQQIDSLKASDLTNTFGQQLSTDQWLQSLYNDKNNAAYQNNAIGANLGLNALQAGSNETLAYSQLAQNQNQFDASMAYNQSQAAADNAYKYAALAQDNNQFNTTTAQNAYQFGVTSGQNQQQIDNQAQQIKNNYGIEMAKLSQSDQQFWANYNQSDQQFKDTMAYSRDQLGLQTYDTNMKWYYQGITADQTERQINAQIANIQANIANTQAQTVSIKLSDTLKQQLQDHNISMDLAQNTLSNATDIMSYFQSTGDKATAQALAAKVGLNLSFANTTGTSSSNSVTGKQISIKPVTSFDRVDEYGEVTDHVTLTSSQANSQATEVNKEYNNLLSQYVSGKTLTEDNIKASMDYMIKSGLVDADNPILVDFYQNAIKNLTR